MKVLSSHASKASSCAEKGTVLLVNRHLLIKVFLQPCSFLSTEKLFGKKF